MFGVSLRRAPGVLPFRRPHSGRYSQEVSRNHEAKLWSNPHGGGNMKRPATTILLVLLLALLGPAAVSGCNPARHAGPQTTPDPDPLAVLVSASPGGDYTVQVLVDPEQAPDDALDVRLLDIDGTDLGLQPAHIDYWATSMRPDHLIAWVDDETLLWNGHITLNMRTGASSAVAGSGEKGTGFLDAVYSAAAGRIAEVWVGDEQLKVWLTPLDGGSPQRIYTYQFEPPHTEVSSDASWRGAEEIFFGVLRSLVQEVVRVRADGTGIPEVIATDAYWPVVSPDGRYLAYTGGGVDGETLILDLETMQPVADGLPGTHPVWSPDSKLVAVRGADAWQVYSLTEGRVAASRPIAGRTALARFDTDKTLTYAELTIEDGVVQRVEIVKVK